ncbi:hypothetical protein ACFL0D_06470 [Thermoproteota archaeon]
MVTPSNQYPLKQSLPRVTIYSTNLHGKRSQLRKAPQAEDQEFKNKLEGELIKLKDRKPELFYITGQKQLSKIKTQLGISVIRWLFK